MDERLISYLYCFNVKQDYFECHEYGESLWLDSGRPVVLKGLIQAAVCLYHLQNGNVKGGWKMWQRAKSYVDAERPVYEGINLDQLVADIDAVFRQVPRHFYSLVVSPHQIKQFDLPVVQIRIDDSKIAGLLATWQPTPLKDH